MRIVIGTALVLTGLCLPGCATVDPRPDYGRVGDVTAHAVGEAQIYRPDEEELVQERTEALLADGLGVEEAVRYALLNNPRFQAAMMNVGMARADLVQSGLWSNPVLGLGVLLPSDGGLVKLQADLSQSISEIWQIRPRRRAAEVNLDAAILATARHAVELVADVKKAYFETVGALALADTSTQAIENARQIHRAAIARRDAGAGTELDVNLAEELELEAGLTELSRKASANEARRNLAALLGFSGRAENLPLTDALSDFAPQVAGADRLIAAARRNRLDLRAADRNALAAGERYRLELRRVLPNFELGLGFERDERRSGEGRSDNSQTYVLGPTINLELPIFDQNRAQIARTLFAFAQAVKEYEAVEQAMIHEVRGAAERAARAWRFVELHRTGSLPLAERNFQLARDSYELGRTSFLNVLEAQRFYLQVQERYFEGLTIAAQTGPLLERTVGLPLSELEPDRLDAAEKEADTESNAEVQD